VSIFMSRNVRRWGLLAITVMILAVLLAVAPLPRIPFWGIDIYTFRAAAKAMMVGADPYNALNIPRFADGATVGNIHNYLYAPYFAFALRPLAWLSPESASRIWFALNLLLYFGSIGLLLVTLRWMPAPGTFLALIGGLVLFPPLRTTLIIGQSTILLLFFFALSLFLLRQGRPFVGGLVFSLGLFKPHLFPLLFFFLIYRQWRWLLGAALGVVILNAPLSGWVDNWFIAAAETRAANLAVDQCFQMVSLVSLLNCTLVWPNWAVTTLVGVTSIVFLGVVWQLTAHRDNSHTTELQTFERRLAAFVVLSALLIDHTRIADQMLLVFPLMVVWRDWYLLRKSFARQLAIFLTLFIYILPYSLDIFGPRQIVFMLPFWYVGVSGAVIGLLLLEWMMPRENPATR